MFKSSISADFIFSCDFLTRKLVSFVSTLHLPIQMFPHSKYFLVTCFAVDVSHCKCLLTPAVLPLQMFSYCKCSLAANVPSLKMFPRCKFSLNANVASLQMSPHCKYPRSANVSALHMSPHCKGPRATNGPHCMFFVFIYDT